MKRKFRIGLLILALVVCTLAGSRIISDRRERAVRSVTPGMSRVQVEALLGEGRPDYMRPACGRCPMRRDQLVYSGNPAWIGVWHGHVEDTLVVCYVQEKVCDTTRVGL